MKTMPMNVPSFLFLYLYLILFSYTLCSQIWCDTNSNFFFLMILHVFMLYWKILCAWFSIRQGSTVAFITDNEGIGKCSDHLHFQSMYLCYYTSSHHSRINMLYIKLLHCYDIRSYPDQASEVLYLRFS